MAEQTHPVQKFMASTTHSSLSFMFSILILSWCEVTVLGMVTLSPVMVAPVCVLDPLLLTCTASVEFIRWKFAVVNEHGMEEEITVSRNSRDLSPPPRERIINSTTFTFTRTSAQFASPLISTLAIDSVHIGLNKTVVRCMDAVNPMTSASTTIYIIDVNQYTPTLSIVSEEYGPDNITVSVIVEMTQQMEAVFTVRVMPLVPFMASGSTIHQLTLTYNTYYNLSVVAVTPCGNATGFVVLDYANCGNPTLLRPVDDSILNVEGYDGLPVEGSTVRFSCPPGLELVGSNSATCTENGEWEPDPSGIRCNDSIETCGHPFRDGASDPILIIGYMDPAMEGTTVTVVCPPQYALIGPNTTTCMGNGEWEPDPREVECKGLEGENIRDSRSTNVLIVTVSSLVVAFLIISLLIFIIGFVCGHYFGRKYKQSPSSLINQPVALYEDVNVLPSAVEHQEQHLELTENVAYGPSKSATMSVIKQK